MITQHAIDRYRERIRPLPIAEVIAILDTPLIRSAVRCGVRSVALKGGGKAVVREGYVVTVLAPGQTTSQGMAVAVAKTNQRRNGKGQRRPRHGEGDI